MKYASASSLYPRYRGDETREIYIPAEPRELIRKAYTSYYYIVIHIIRAYIYRVSHTVFVFVNHFHQLFRMSQSKTWYLFLRLSKIRDSLQ